MEGIIVACISSYSSFISDYSAWGLYSIISFLQFLFAYSGWFMACTCIVALYDITRSTSVGIPRTVIYILYGIVYAWRLIHLVCYRPWLVAYVWLSKYWKFNHNSYVLPPLYSKPPVAFEAQKRMPMYYWWKQHYSVWSLLIILPAAPLALYLLAQLYLVIHSFGFQKFVVLGVTTTWVIPYYWFFSLWYLSNWFYGYSTDFVLSVAYFMWWCWSIWVTARVVALLPVLWFSLRGRDLGYDNLRGSFRKMLIYEPTTIYSSHSHPKTAAERNAADISINGFIASVGREAYSIQLSAMDSKRKIRGSLVHYWSRDKLRPYSDDDISELDLIKLFNVDYYIDWAKYLWMAKPFLLYTFSPIDPCGTHLEYMWTTNIDNTITMKVSGGATYTHQLWNYDCDSFVAKYPGIHIHYKVESIRVHKHWKFVLLIPAYLEQVLDQTSDVGLKRMQLVHTVDTLSTLENGTGKRVIASIYNYGSTNEFSVGLSLSLPGEYVSALLPPALIAILKARYEKETLKSSDVQTIITVDFRNDPRLPVALVYSAFPVEEVKHDHISSTESKNRAKVYKRVPLIPEFESQSKVPVAVLCPPVLDDSWVPARSIDNDRWTIAERITGPHSKLDAQTIDPQYVDYMIEFSKLLLPKPSVLAPCDVSQVMVEQDRPTQRRNNAAAEPHLNDFIATLDVQIDSFMKLESYGKVSPPRNISTLPTEHCLLYSQFTRPLSQLLKTTKWYAFGMHPNKIALRVHEIAMLSKTMAETDFSRFDGTHSQAMYEFEQLILKRAYPLCFHDMIVKLHNAMTQSKCRTGYGLEYFLGGSRASGAADTSLFNTIDNAFVMFCMYRKSGKDIKQSWDSLGIYGGDDGITPDPHECLPKVCQDLGFNLKLQIRESYMPVEFLARVYPQPQVAPYNMCNIGRMMNKAHIYPSGDPTVNDHKELYLLRKAQGYLVMDPHTPIISNWCRLIMRCCSVSSIRKQQIFDRIPVDYSVRVFEDQPNAYPVPGMVAVASISQLLGISTQQVLDYCQLLDDSKTLDDIKLLVPTEVGKYDDIKGVQIGNNLATAPVAGELGVGVLKSPPPPFDRPGVLDYPKLRYTADTTKFSTKPAYAPSFIECVKKMAGTRIPYQIIDACAHVGIDTLLLNKAFPNSKIYAVEKDATAFNCLVVNTTGSRRISPMHQDFYPELKGKHWLYLDPPWTSDRKVVYRGKPIEEWLLPSINRTILVKVPKECTDLKVPSLAKTSVLQVKHNHVHNYNLIMVYTDDIKAPPVPTIVELADAKRTGATLTRYCAKCHAQVQLDNEILKQPEAHWPKLCSKCQVSKHKDRAKHMKKHGKHNNGPQKQPRVPIIKRGSK